MCGRYYVDDETAREIEKLVRQLDRKIATVEKKDVFPSQKATVIRGKEQSLNTEQMVWGFPRFDGKGLLINARAESVLEKRSFQESVHQRRCVIPAKGFYEWNRSKEKFTFQRQDSPILFMAGCFREFDGMDRFVILTTEANHSVEAVHDRMPLILEPKELENWVLDDGATEYFLHKTPALLERNSEYEQMRLF